MFVAVFNNCLNNFFLFFPPCVDHVHFPFIWKLPFEFYYDKINDLKYDYFIPKILFIIFENKYHILFYSLVEHTTNDETRDRYLVTRNYIINNDNNCYRK